MRHIVRPPRCYGLAYDISTQECQACLLAESCKSTYELPLDERIPSFESVHVEDTTVEIPKKKSELVLAVCEKFGIKPTIVTRDMGEVIVTKENLADFFDIGCILTSKEALRKLLTTKLAT